MLKNWQIEWTEDGSPSLRELQTPQQEMMHHRGGALTETRYIYEPVIRAAAHFPARILSLGLGLGYNEMICFQVEEESSTRFQIFSFEKDPWLRDQFQTWASGAACELSEIYSQIASRVGDETRLRERISSALAEGRLSLLPALTTAEQIPAGLHVYLWDAFSRSTSPELWDEEFLNECLERADQSWAQLSTYAQVGPLKRALKRQGFTIQERPGFQGKRHSTWATRITEK